MKKVRQLEKIDIRMNALHRELDDFSNVTRARRIRINIMLDALANTRRRLDQ